MLGREGEPGADVVVLVSLGEQDAEDEFFIVPVNVLYHWAEDRHRRYWATRPGEVTGESNLVQIRDADADVREFINPYEDAWGYVTDARHAPD